MIPFKRGREARGPRTAYKQPRPPRRKNEGGPVVRLRNGPRFGAANDPQSRPASGRRFELGRSMAEVRAVGLVGSGAPLRAAAVAPGEPDASGQVDPLVVPAPGAFLDPPRAASVGGSAA